MTDTVIAWRDTRIVVARIARDVSKRAAVFLRRLWRAYWDYQMRRATAAVLRKLDDRTLADIGIDRNEIAALVYDRKPGRLRRRGSL